MTLTLNRRDFLIGSSTLAAASASGIMSARANAADIRMAFWGSKARADRTFGVADLFRAKNGGIGIGGEFAAWDDYWPRLATQTAGGNAPDIVQMDIRYLVEYSKRKAIAPLDTYLKGGLDLTSYDPDLVEGGRIGGQLYAVALGANTVAQLVNLDGFAKAGIAPPTRDHTFADLYEWAEAFKKSGKMKVVSDGSWYEPGLENWLRQRGKALYTQTGTIGFDADDMTDWFQLWVDLRKAGVCIAPEDQANTTVDPLTAGKAALYPQNSNQIIAFQSLTTSPISIATMPRIAKAAGGGHYRKPTMFWAVSETSRNKKSAIDFINFFVNDTEAGAILGVERGAPPSSVVRQAIASKLDKQSLLAVSLVADLGDLAGPMPPPPPLAAGEIDLSLLRTIGQEVAFGARSPADGAKAFTKGAADILKRK